MKQLFLLVALTFIALIIVSKDRKRAVYYLLGTFFIPTPFGGAHLMFPLAFIISLILNRQIKESIIKYPLFSVTIAILFTLFFISLYDDRLTGFSVVTVPVSYFLNSFIFLYIGFNLIKNKYEYLKITYLLAIILLIYSIYGIFTWLIQDNPLYHLYKNIYGLEGVWLGIQQRGYRVTSFLDNPIAYGMVMAVGSMSLLVYQKMIHSKWLIYIIILVIFNVVIANSRTSWISFLIMVILFFSLYYKLSLKWILSIVTLVCIVFIASFFSNLAIFDSLTDLYTTGGHSVQGSTIELKILQLSASFSLFLESPILGHGINYFRDVIQSRYGGSTDLAGLEGYGYRLLVEMGVIMIIVFGGYVYQFLKTIYDARKKSRVIASIVFAQFAAFIFYIFTTGEYGGVFEYCMIMIGINYRMIFVEQERKNKKYLQIKQIIDHENLNVFQTNDV